MAVNIGGVTRHFGLFNLVAPYGTPVAFGAAPFGVPIVFTALLREADVGLDLSLEELPQPDLQSMDLTIWGTPWWGNKNERPLESHNSQRGNCLNEQTGGSWGPAPPTAAPKRRRWRNATNRFRSGPCS